STPGSGQNAVLTIATLLRPFGSGSTVNFSGPGLGGASNKILAGLAPVLTNGILPYALAGGEVAGYSAVNGFQAYSAIAGNAYTDNTTTGALTGTAAQNVRVLTGVTSTAGTNGQTV